MLQQRRVTVHPGAMCSLLLALLTAGSGDASLRAKHGASDQSVRGSVMRTCKRAGVLRGGGETPARAASPRVGGTSRAVSPRDGGTSRAESPRVIRKSDDEDLRHEGPAARQAFDLGKEYMAKYQFEMAISCFNAVSVFPHASARSVSVSVYSRLEGHMLAL